jgi:hypothetical protein
MASPTAATVPPSGAVTLQNVTPVDDAAVAPHGEAVAPQNVTYQDDLVSMEGGGEGEGGWEVEEGGGSSEAVLLYARDGSLAG